MTTIVRPYAFQARSYYLLLKPGILMGNLLVAAAGFCLAARNHFDVLLFFMTVIGLLCVIASSCILNNCIDRAADQKMERTKKRALAQGTISVQTALLLSALLGGLGLFFLSVFTNGLTVALALFGWIVYILLYSFAKYQTSQGTLIGSFAGAIPPVVGYCAVTNAFDGGALLLFLMLIFWQMPHFFAISIYRKDDYQRASIPVYPIHRGMLATKRQMLFYSFAFLLSAPMPSLFGYIGPIYGTLVTLLAMRWFQLCWKGFQTRDDVLWARHVFQFSLILITSLCVLMIVGM